MFTVLNKYSVRLAVGLNEIEFFSSCTHTAQGIKTSRDYIKIIILWMCFILDTIFIAPAMAFMCMSAHFMSLQAPSFSPRKTPRICWTAQKRINTDRIQGRMYGKFNLSTMLFVEHKASERNKRVFASSTPPPAQKYQRECGIIAYGPCMNSFMSTGFSCLCASHNSCWKLQKVKQQQQQPCWHKNKMWAKK